MEASDAWTRITLPRRYARSDLAVAVVSAAVALWMAVWVDDLAASYPRPSTLGLAIMLGVTLAFAAVAVAEGLRIVAPRVVEARVDRVILGRQLGARTVLRRSIARADILAVDRVRDEDELMTGAAGAVRIRTRDGDHHLGRRLDGPTTDWLEEAVRRLATGEVRSDTGDAASAGDPISGSTPEA